MIECIISDKEDIIYLTAISSVASHSSHSHSSSAMFCFMLIGTYSYLHLLSVAKQEKKLHLLIVSFHNAKHSQG